MADLPVATIKRIVKKFDREVRVGEDATAVIITASELIIAKIAKESTDLAKYAGRKTIQVADVKMACKKLGYPTE